MSFTDSTHINTPTGVIFLAKLVIISSLVIEFSAASSIQGISSSSSTSIDNTERGGSTSSSSGGSGGGSSGNYYSGTEVWFRNLDTQLLRLGSRLDQLMIRMDHLDSRVGRVQSQGHLRFDSIETSMQTTRQRLDLWSNQLNLIEEQLSRKWKNMETRFDSLVNSIDSKLDSKFNLIQRDNRRHNEFLSSSFNSVIISQEKLSDRVANSVAEMNSSVAETRYIVSNSTASLLARFSRECASSANNSDRVINLVETFVANLTAPAKSCSPQQNYRNNNLPLEQLPPPSSPHYNNHQYTSHHPHNNHSQVQLITTKVNNMFDELVKRSYMMEAILKDTFTMSNATRREVQDGFRALIPIANQISQLSTSGRGGLNSGRSISSLSSSSSSEVMSAMVVEALASVESMSTSLGRRMSELKSFIDERFQMVSMTLNGFFESCLRIQERAPLIEEHIAIILERLLDSVDNSTRNATLTWMKVKDLLWKEQRQYQHHPRQNASSCSERAIIEQYLASLHQQSQQQPLATNQGHPNFGVTPPGGEQNKSSDSWLHHHEEADDHQLGEHDEEGDNNDGDEDESGEPLKPSRSRVLSRTTSGKSHHLRHQHRSNIMMNLGTSSTQGHSFHSEGEVMTGSRTSSMTFANSHNNNNNNDNNANLPQQGVSSQSSSSIGLIPPSSSVTNNGMDGRSGDLPELSEEEKKSLWESWLNVPVPE